MRVSEVVDLAFGAQIERGRGEFGCAKG